jgi:hypothetical protein
MKSYGWTVRKVTATQNLPYTRHPTLQSPSTIATDHVEFRGWQWRHTTKQTARLPFDTAHYAQQNTHNYRRGLIFPSTIQHRFSPSCSLLSASVYSSIFRSTCCQNRKPKFLTSGKLHLSLPLDCTARTILNVYWHLTKQFHVFLRIGVPSVGTIYQSHCVTS